MMSNRVYANSLPFILAFKEDLDAREAFLLKNLGRVLKVMPIYTEFLAEVKGIGPAIAAGLLAYTQSIDRFPSMSHMIAYFGLHVVDGHAPRKKAGERANWHGQARSLLLGVLGDSFVKQRTPIYRDVYDREKEKQLPICEGLFKGRKVVKKDGSDGKIPWKMVAEKRARRKATKLFCKKYFKAYRRLGAGEEWRAVLDEIAFGESALMPEPKARVKKKAAVVA